MDSMVSLCVTQWCDKGLLIDTSEFVYNESNIKRVRNLANCLK